VRRTEAGAVVALVAGDEVFQRGDRYETVQCNAVEAAAPFEEPLTWTP